ncbi:Xaa-Pro peptidase family protein [Conexibacter sp. JD483]|uniref:M24 family metallopeptidase n=1 Tax=unclassified Conexibacter TaxID=2627773 RepID=UPI002715A4A9|nr:MULTISPECIES: Xaa-Pro peptidase family protein [unclassified Conexibacter]MDO8187948.1 Xaa-Pro peptidase family protein [Conexibacter sp. CPCC 205706]MDO8200183.1 Xaa-Pro peptidase family protein [Conexibacter sp. CPCC 205762]MDR9369729.1 Xaa-Pro peptidase family protein [Conexibacter sp. JD483]
MATRESSRDAPDHAARLRAFGDALGAAGFDAAIVSQPQDLYYLTGAAQPSNLVVVPGQRPVLLARRFAELTRAQAPQLEVRSGASFSAVERELRRAGVERGRLGFELDVVPAALYRRALAAFPRFAIEDCAPLLLAQRAVKDPFEVARLRRAAACFERLHETLVAHLRPGRSELELAAEAERTLRRAGHAGIVAQRRWDAALQPEGAIASGPNLATMSGGPITVSGVGLSRATPFGASARAIAAGDLVNVDLGINLDGYHADMARTYVVGEPSERVVELAGHVRAIEDALLAAVRPGLRASDLHAVGVAAAERLGVADVFQGHGGEQGPYVGHGIGLELDEPPVLGPREQTVLAEGMVLAIEPKLISPGFGAVNLEDDVVVRADGCELLSAMPRVVFVLDGAGGLRGELS